MLVKLFPVLLAIFMTVVGASAQTSFAKIAIINSDAFLDPKTGITRYIATQNKLNGEFQTKSDELKKLQTQIQTLQDAFAKLPSTTESRVAADKKDEIDRLTRDYQFRVENTKADYDGRLKVLMQPISDDVDKAMSDYAKKNGIDVLIDVSKTEGVYVFNNAADVTNAFAAYFNALPAKP